MGRDLPAGVLRELESYARAEHTTPENSAAEFIKSGNRAKRRKEKPILVTDEQISRLKELDSGFGLLEDVPEAKIDRT